MVLDSHSHVLHSDIVGDDYQLSVLPPPSYQESSDRYATLYALDGPFTFGLVAHGSLLLTFDEIIPEMIVVEHRQAARQHVRVGPDPWPRLLASAVARR